MPKQPKNLPSTFSNAPPPGASVKVDKFCKGEGVSMAEKDSSGKSGSNVGALFNKKATEKLNSPDDLDNYVRVARPGV